MFSVTSTFNLNARCEEESSTMDVSTRVRRFVSPTVLMNQTHYGYRNRSYDPILDIEEKPIEACHSLYFLLDFFHQYYIPSIILLGLVGNLLSCIVFLNTHLRIRSSSYYLAALATADFGFLVTLLLVWLNNTLGWKVFNKDGWCETLVYVSAVCSSLSVWLIVAFTIERFIAVQYPLHRPHMCTIARAKAIVLVLVILALVSHSYSFVTAGVVPNKDGEEYCDLKVEYLETMKIISIIDSIASLIAPLVLIIVMNTMIMRNLLKFSRRFRETSTTFTDCPSRERSDINLNQIPNIYRPDMIQLMIESRDTNGRELTIDEMATQAFSFFQAGYGTSTTFLCFAVHEIAANPDVQGKLRAEIEAVARKTNGRLTYDAIKDMAYMDAVLNEITRLYPVTTVLDRVCVKEFELPPATLDSKPVTLKPGAMVAFMPFAMQRDPKYFTDPLKFDPDRFLSNNVPQNVCFPFGLGPRVCIGNRFAMMVVKIPLFYLLSRCDVELCAESTHPIRLSKKTVLLDAENGFWLKMKTRKNYILRVDDAAIK